MISSSLITATYSLFAQICPVSECALESVLMHKKSVVDSLRESAPTQFYGMRLTSTSLCMSIKGISSRSSLSASPLNPTPSAINSS